MHQNVSERLKNGTKNAKNIAKRISSWGFNYKLLTVTGSLVRSLYPCSRPTTAELRVRVRTIWTPKTFSTWPDFHEAINF